jgi:hypothetical protein
MVTWQLVITWNAAKAPVPLTHCIDALQRWLPCKAGSLPTIARTEPILIASHALTLPVLNTQGRNLRRRQKYTPSRSSNTFPSSEPWGEEDVETYIYL